ncbi:hypothetical protein [Streptomyces hirsutus]|uniref:hypothetical protein n=1 Tax=Streptomyces hirsutus TaxID=35620 RepID=UPI0033238C2B
MTEETPTAWVGDQVYDANADKEGVVTDVKNGTYVLRPLHGYWGHNWTAPNAEELTVTVPRQERVKQAREA